MATEIVPAPQKPTPEEIREMARGVTSGSMGAAAVIEEFAGDEEHVHMYAILKPLEEVVARVKSGDLGDMEEMLVAQALALQGVFVHFASNASAKKGLQRTQHMLTMGLKAQAQCRATVQTLIDLKYPRQAVFAKQANITSGPQQVNNGVSQPAATHAHAERAEETRIKQLEDATDATQRMVFGETKGAKQGHQDLAPVGKIDRSEDSGRQSPRREKRVQRGNPPPAAAARQAAQ